MQFLLSKSLRQLTKLYTKAIVTELPGLSSEYCVQLILLLASQRKPVAQMELALALQVDESRIISFVESLLKDSYISTEQDSDGHFVSLTAKGRELVPVIQCAMDKVNTIINKHIDKDDLNSFYYTLQQMSENLTGQLADPLGIN
jgi:DNA-binding MarR family transcriptional regulator